MDTNKLNSQSLEKASKLNLPESIIQKAKICLQEFEDDASYAADELVELAEEILAQLAAIGFATYLKQPNQKTVYNDFLINLFTSGGHSYNAGPLYKWATNMIKDAEGEDVKSILPFFTTYKDEFIRLSSLRNEVMHGFFVLPPERNIKEAELIAGLLGKIADAKIFENLKHHFHFINQNGFNGNWSVSTDADWSLFNNCFQFTELAQRISVELSDAFIKAEIQFVNSDKITVEVVNKNAIDFITNNKKGAAAFWHRPNDNNAIQAYQSVVQQLQKDENILPVFYRLQDVGLTLTSSFLLRVLGKSLSADTGNAKYQSDTIKTIKNKELISKRKKKPVVVLYGVHIGLFNENHLLKLANTLFDAEIPLIVFGEHYAYLDRFVNQTFSIHSSAYIPNESQWKPALHNYLRFKGPSLEKSDEKEDYDLLCKIMSNLTAELNEVCKTEGGNVVARRFADKYNYPIEYVHECFAILNPFLQSGKEDFIKDEVDKLYGFPKDITETTAIFLSLGRRDVKLEYKHKTLSL